MVAPEAVEPEKAAVIELPRVSDDRLKYLEDTAGAPICGGDDLVSAIRELRALRQTVAIAQADAEKWHQELSNTCAMLVQMHAACVGDTDGPRQGLVEDIAMMRQYAIRSRIALDQAVELSELQEKRIDELTRARDTLGNRLLEVMDPKDQVGRARVQALLKAGHVEEETPTIVPA